MIIRAGLIRAGGTGHGFFQYGYRWQDRTAGLGISWTKQGNDRHAGENWPDELSLSRYRRKPGSGPGWGYLLESQFSHQINQVQFQTGHYRLGDGTAAGCPHQDNLPILCGQFFMSSI